MEGREEGSEVVKLFCNEASAEPRGHMRKYTDNERFKYNAY